MGQVMQHLTATEAAEGPERATNSRANYESVMVKVVSNPLFALAPLLDEQVSNKA